ncbi:MAG: NAD(P)/FAD-dependent oxidoreductase [Anaerolineales bacterium]
MTKTSNDIIIIGAGIAGMAAGCYAQMNGYKTRIFEMHHLPGGLCTSWQRKGYTFDGCIYYLFGSGTGKPYNDFWLELGAVQNRKIFNHEEFMQIRAMNGQRLVVYSDPDRLQDHLLELSPADRRPIRQLCSGIRAFSSFDLTRLQQKPKALMSPADWARLGADMLPYTGLLAKWGLISAEDFARRFKDPFLRRAVPLMFAWRSIPVMIGMSFLACANDENAGFPEGGSLEFARAIEKRYLELGGEIHYRAQVERILVEDDRAVGVRLYNNDEHRARRVISACDGRATVFNMLRGKYAGRRLRRLYDGHLPISTQLQVSIGVKRDLSAEPHLVNFLLDRPRDIAGQEHRSVGIRHYGFDPSMAPEGRSAIVMTLDTAYDYWQRIYGRTIYDHEQIQEADMLIDLLEEIYPGIQSEIELIDVATPLSYERFTGNWRGSICGWLLTKETLPMKLIGMRSTLPGLKDFYMTGQWVEPGGGLQIVATSGRNIVRQLCAEDKKEFTTQLPC